MARSMVLIVGSVGVGLWIMSLLNVWMLRLMALPHRAIVPEELVLSAPTLVAGGAAGLLLGYVAEGGKLYLWAVGLVVTILIWTYAPLLIGPLATTSWALFVLAAQAVGASLTAVGGLWLGRHVRDREPDA